MSDDDETNDGQIVEKEIVNPTLSHKINSFLLKAKINTNDVMYYVYKYDESLGKNVKAIVDKTSIEPDEDSIGREYGGGKYLVVLVVSGDDKNMRSYEFRLHKRYDIIADETKRSKNAFPVQVQPQQLDPTAMMASTMAMMKSVMDIFQPMMRPQAPPQQQLPDFSSVLLSNFQNMNEMMRGQAVEMQKLIREISRKQLDEEIDNQYDDVDEPGEEQGILSMIMPLLSEYIPKLLGNGPESKAISTVVRAAPQFKKIISNTGTVSALVDHLDKTQGKEKTDAILTKLKVVRPGGRTKRG